MRSYRMLVPLAGFLAGLAPLVFWYYLYWAPLSWSIISGVTVAVLSSIIWALPNVSRRMRGFAVAVLALIAVAYVVIVAGILSVSHCGFIDGRFYCTHRYF
jgi:hypothetical protein